MRSFYAAMVAGLRHGLRCGFGALLCLALTAHAGMSTDVTSPRVIASGWDVVYNATVGAAPSTGGIGTRSYGVAQDVWGDVLQVEKGWVTRSGTFARTAAPNVEVAVTRRIEAAAVGRAAYRLLPIVGTAMVAYDIWQAIGCAYDSGSKKLVCKEDVTGEGVVGQWVSSLDENTPKRGYGSGAAACNARCKVVGFDYHSVTSSNPGATCRCFNEWHTNITNQGSVYIDEKLVVTNSQSQKEYGEDQAGDKWGREAPKVPGYADKAPGIMGQADQNGVGVPAGAPSISGPATQKGEPVVSQQSGPNGTTQQTVTPTYNYTYQTTNEGARVTYNVTNNTVTTVTNNAGETVTTESSDTQPETKDDRSECEKNPDTVGCMKVGEVADESVNKLTKDVAVTAEDVNLPAACPAPIVAGKYTLTFDSACGFATGVRPFVIAAAALMAALIVLRSIQGA